MKLTTLDLLVIVAYIARTLGRSGCTAQERQTSRDEYFLADRPRPLAARGRQHHRHAALHGHVSLRPRRDGPLRGGSYFLGLLALPFVIPVVTRLIIPVLLALRITSAVRVPRAAFLQRCTEPRQRWFSSFIR